LHYVVRLVGAGLAAQVADAIVAGDDVSAEPIEVVEFDPAEWTIAALVNIKRSRRCPWWRRGTTEP
jgi:hypothetical protein